MNNFTPYHSLIFFISSLLITCTCMREYQYNISYSEITNSVDSVYSKIGLDVQYLDSNIYVDGPFNRDLEISLEKINENLTLIRYETALSNEFYIENMNSLLSFNLSNEIQNTRAEKSKTKFTFLNIISPGLGWYYMTDNSVYWPKENIFSSIVMAGFDAILIYRGLFAKKKEESKLERIFKPFSQKDALVAAISLRLFSLIPGYYFVEYDNKLYKAGININF